MGFIETLAVAFIPALLTAAVAYYRNRIDILKYKSDSMAESTAKHFLENQSYTDRKFPTIKKHLGGWDKDEDELRRILVRAGAIRTFGKEDQKDVEYWTLLSRIEQKKKKVQ